MLDLRIIVGSVRPGRVGLPVGLWVERFASADDRFEVTLLDLAEIDLPFMDEPNMPHLGQYTKEHTKRWSALVEPADAYILVSPEYNATPAPALKNAIDYLSAEWKYKPVAFASYGGVSGGMRAAQSLKPTLLQMNMMPVPEGIVIPFVSSMIDDEGVFTPTEPVEHGATSVLNALARWAEALRPLRSS